MADAIELLELIFDYGHGRGHFVAGEIVKGAVVVVSGEELVAKQIQVELKGEGRNGWVNKTSDKIYESVQYPLPNNLPSSFEGEYGHIRYTARASLHPLGHTQGVVTDRIFKVQALLDLNSFPITKHPVEAIDSTDFSCCCFPLGTVQASITIPRNGYLPGELINIKAEIHNGSRKKVEECQISLIQHARFSATSRYENAEDCKEMQYVVSGIVKGDIDCRRTMRIQNEVLHVPLVIPTQHGNNLNINYILRLEANPGIEIEIPITIGSVNTCK